ncbi:MAG: response regulator [Salibacteraceae bacterium]
MKKLNCIVLIDDDKMTNYLNQRIIKKSGLADHLLIFKNGKEGLEYLKNPDASDYISPNLIFLDINMPVMNGFEFLEEYNKLDASLRADKLMVMLTTSLLTRDVDAAKSYEVSEFINKPLDEDKLRIIIEKYYEERG